MAWASVPNNTNWEYSTDPDTDKKSQDTYDYAGFTSHVNGVVHEDGSVIWKAVLTRQTTNPSGTIPGYGELIMWSSPAVPSSESVGDGGETAFDGAEEVFDGAP